MIKEAQLSESNECGDFDIPSINLNNFNFFWNQVSSNSNQMLFKNNNNII